MKMHRKNITIEMTKGEKTAVGKFVGILEAMTKDENEVRIIEVTKLNKVYLTVMANIFEYWKIRKAIKRRYSDVCVHYY